MENIGKGLLAQLSLLFVPAGVGVVQRLDLIAAHGVAICAILALSLIATLLATLFTFRLVSRQIVQRDP
jgi:putative effector of murein hydrolase LrgA (UPF0299 family)